MSQKNKRGPYVRSIPVCGVGVNDFIGTIDDTTTRKAYGTWSDMLRRCYSKKLQERNPSYIGCIVCEEWKHFSKFFAWYLENYVSGYSLDKDIILHGNTVYCPESCIFVPIWLNSFVTDSKRKRGNYPIGVSYHKRVGKFISTCGIGGKLKHLGYFVSSEDAHSAWKEEKRRQVNEMKVQLDEIDVRLYPSLIGRYS